MIRQRALALLVFAVLAACESSPRPRKSEPAQNPPVLSDDELDAEELVRVAQTLRDREFERPPKLVPRDTVDQTELSGCDDRCEDERRWLTKILFAEKPPVFSAPGARYDREHHEIRYDRNLPAKARRAAVLSELVRALDDVRATPVDSWDAYLASAALRRGSGVFVAALDRAKQRNEAIDAERLAVRPEGLYNLEFVANRFADSFTTREGFAFVAAMYRSGGWSTVELAYHERPARTLEIVRPDRYLAGDQPGQWTLPEELRQARQQDGLQPALDGRVGPALLAEWLGQRIPVSAARGVYIGFESDRYQLYTKDGDWAFDWVSLWATPSIAQQVVEALDAGLRQRSDGSSFVVMRHGATVAVVGASSPNADLATPATALVGALPVFGAPRPRGVEFEPTPIDRIAARPLLSSVARSDWTDLATGLVIDLATLPASWQLLPTQEPNLPWFAKHESGAVLQYLVEPQPLFDPAFHSPEYLRTVRERFGETVVSEGVATVARADTPASGALLIDATGTIRDRPNDPPVRLRAWQFEHGPFVTTLSLQAPPDAFDQRAQELTTLIDSIQLVESSEAASGTIEFSVED